MIPSPQPECRTHVNRPVCSANILGAYSVPWPGKQPRMRGGVNVKSWRWGGHPEKGDKQVPNNCRCQSEAHARRAGRVLRGWWGRPSELRQGTGCCRLTTTERLPWWQSLCWVLYIRSMFQQLRPHYSDRQPRGWLSNCPKEQVARMGLCTRCASGKGLSLTLTATVNSEDLRVLKKLETSAGRLWPSQCFSGFHAHTHPS